MVDGKEGRKSLELVRGIYQSGLKGEKLYLPFKDEEISGIN